MPKRKLEVTMHTVGYLEGTSIEELDRLRREYEHTIKVLQDDIEFILYTRARKVAIIEENDAVSKG